MTDVLLLTMLRALDAGDTDTADECVSLAADPEAVSVLLGQGVEEAESYTPPESARNNARKVLRWRDEHGDAVKGMTAVGWTRANQLAKGGKLSRETVGRMAAFARHKKNSEVAPEYKSEPWRDAGYVAWLGWGGTSGIEWAAGVINGTKESYTGATDAASTD
jgi:hypothetical protein